MILGIDFGTCYTSVSAMSGSELLHLNVDNSGDAGVPSQFMYDSTLDKEVFGMGCTTCDIVTSGADIVKYMKRFVRENPNQINAEVHSGGNNYTIGEVIEMFLEYVLNKAVEAAEMTEITNLDIERVVITAPVGINKEQMNATDYNSLIRNVIMKVTGLDKSKVTVLEEPVAAAVSYLYRENLRKTEYLEKQNVMVFDLGGGTLDVSIVEHDPKTMTYKVKAKEGCLSLGGNDWDAKFAEFLINKHKIDIYDDEQEQYYFHECVLEAKHYLSSKENFSIWQPTINLNVNVTRSEFERATEELLDEAMDIVDRVYQQFDGSIDKIILVGGSSNMPQIKNRLIEEYAELVGGEDNIFVFSPSKAISNGAAIFAKMQEVRPAPIINIANCTYGFECKDSRDQVMKIYNMIFKNEEFDGEGKLTSNAKDTFHSTNADAKSFQVEVYESQVLRDDCYEGCWQPIDNTAKKHNIKLSIPVPSTYEDARDYKVSIKFVLSQDGILDIVVTDMDGNEVATARGNTH